MLNFFLVCYLVSMFYQVTIFDLVSDTPESLWERLTDGIVRAWSYDQGKYINS